MPTQLPFFMLQYLISLLISEEQMRSSLLGWKSSDVTPVECPVKVRSDWPCCKSIYIFIIKGWKSGDNYCKDQSNHRHDPMSKSIGHEILCSCVCIYHLVIKDCLKTKYKRSLPLKAYQCKILLYLKLENIAGSCQTITVQYIMD